MRIPDIKWTRGYSHLSCKTEIREQLQLCSDTPGRGTRTNGAVCVTGSLHEKELEKELAEAQQYCESLLHAIKSLSEQSRRSTSASKHLSALPIAVAGSGNRSVPPFTYKNGSV